MGLDLFFPRELIKSMKVSTDPSMQSSHKTHQSPLNAPPPAHTLQQPKQLRRLIQQTFQGYSTLKQDECISRFFSTLAQCYTFTQESFACQLVVRGRLDLLEWTVLGWNGVHQYQPFKHFLPILFATARMEPANTPGDRR